MADGFQIGRDKRRYVRIKSELRVNLRSASDDSDALFRGVTNNVSEGGICMEVEEDIGELLSLLAKADFPFHVSIELVEPNENIEVDAVSRWTDGRVEWVKMPPAKGEVLHLGLAFRGTAGPALSKIRAHIGNLSEDAS